MNKQDIAIVVLLFLGLLGWGYYQRRQAILNPPVPPVAESVVAGSNRVDQATTTLLAAPAATPVAAPAAAATPVVAPVAAAEPVAHTRPEQTLLLKNAVAGVTVSSWGGAITQVELSDYKASVDPDSGPVVLDLSSHPALSLVGLVGFSAGSDYELRYAPDGNAVIRKAA